jgi:hypothetical protein
VAIVHERNLNEVNKLIEYGFIVAWIASFLLGAYLVIVHHDYWVGIPAIAFGTMLFWGFALDGILYIKQRFVNQNAQRLDK